MYPSALNLTVRQPRDIVPLDGSARNVPRLHFDLKNAISNVLASQISPHLILKLSIKETMIKIFISVLCVISAFATRAEEMSDEQKTLYALGAIIAKQIAVFSLSPTEMELVKKGLGDSLTEGKPLVDVEAYGPKVQALAASRRALAGTKQEAAGKAYLEQAGKANGAESTPTGLIYIASQNGAGANPTLNDIVKVHYRGTLIDGTEFDSSFKRGEPVEFPLTGVIKCWSEGVQKMKVGGKARLVCPPAIAYGEQGAGPIPPNATLNFEVELIGIKAAAPEGDDKK
jgi:FKBP-type peptidyl-prolyl cis-trans isomerase FkpA